MEVLLCCESRVWSFEARVFEPISLTEATLYIHTKVHTSCTQRRYVRISISNLKQAASNRVPLGSHLQALSLSNQMIK